MNAPVPLTYRPPHDPFTLRLSAATGWRLTDGLPAEIAADGDTLHLAALADADAFADPTLGGRLLPPWLAADPCHGLILFDRRRRRLKVFDACDCRFRDIPCGSGDSDDRRTLIAPVAIAAGCGFLFVADAGGVPPGDPHRPRPPRPGRIIVLALPSLALAGVLVPPAHAELPQPWRPAALALGPGGTLYVADPANGAVHHFNSQHRHVAALTGFGAVEAVALDRAGRILTFVLGEARVRVSDRTGREVASLATAAALSEALVPPPFPVGPNGEVELSALCRAAGVATDAAWFDAGGNPVAAPAPDPAALATSGTVVLGPLDSRIGDCEWHAVRLDARLPQNTRIAVASLTLEVARSAAAIAEVPTPRWRPSATFSADPCAPVALLRSPPGRYLWLRFTLEGDGEASPAVRLVDVEFPRLSLRRHLPAVFGAEPLSADFTDRFLAIFDEGRRTIERQVDRLPALYDPQAAPADRVRPDRPDFLSWLAAWIGVRFDPAMTVPERRRLLTAAGRLRACAGTLAGLRGKLLVFLGLDGELCRQPATDCAPACPPPPEPWTPPPLILEHYRLRRWLALGAATLGDRAMVWGERLVNRSTLGSTALTGRSQLKACTDPKLDPWAIYAHRLTVFLPAALSRSSARKSMIERLIATELPAHVEATIDYVEPRFRIGIQSSLGFDSVIACLPSGVTLGEGELGRATILEPSPRAGQPGLARRLGHDTRLQ